MNNSHEFTNQIFGTCLMKIRKSRGRSQKFIAVETGLDASYLAGIEHGRRPPPKSSTLEKLFIALGVTQEERRELKSAIAIEKLAKIASTEFEPSYGKSLIRIASAIQFCSVEELRALEIITQGLEQRHNSTIGRPQM